MLHERAQVDGQVEAQVGDRGGGHRGDPQVLHEHAQVGDRPDGEVPDNCQVGA